jgi:hypothetical protein
MLENSGSYSLIVELQRLLLDRMIYTLEALHNSDVPLQLVPPTCKVWDTPFRSQTDFVKKTSSKT